MRIAFVFILLVLCISGCCTLPDDISISVNDDFDHVNHILKCIKAKPSGEGIVKDAYFEDFGNNGNASWYLLPDKTMLGLNLLKTEDQKKLHVKQILLGEHGTGYIDRIRWDMQVKTLFQKIDIANYLKKNEKSKTIQFGVGQDYENSVSEALMHSCKESKNYYDYDEQSNIKYQWIELPDDTVIQVCGFYNKEASEKKLILVELLICNSHALFDHRVESWYSAQNLRMTNLGKKIWGIDVQSSYFNIYKGMHLSDALKTIESAKCDKIENSLKIDLKKTKILSYSINSKNFVLSDYQQYQLNDDSVLLVKSSEPAEYANNKVSQILLYSKAPDLDNMSTTHYLIEFEFIDLVDPLMQNWFEQLN